MRSTIRRLTLLSSALVFSFVAACKSAPPPAPEPKVEAPPPEPAKPPEPVINLPDPATLGPTPTGLAGFDDSKDNPTTATKVELGYKLFFDPRLSKDGSMSCSSCHVPEKGWATSNPTDAKVGGAANKRNSPAVVNLGYHAKGFYWDGRMPTMEAVSNAAWKGQLGADPAATATKLAGDPVVKAYFKRAFDQDPTADNVPMALAAFLRQLQTGNSAFDKFQAGDKKALSADAAKGWALFQSKGCVQCHAVPWFSDYDFHAVGVGAGKPDDQKDHGRKDATKADEDDGKFMTPSLRNAPLTAPYFHDGSAATLDDAITTMAAGPAKGQKLDEKFKAQKVSKKEVGQIKAFIESLAGEYSFTKAADPFPSLDSVTAK